MTTTTEIHFVGRLTFERAVRELLVVLVHVEFNELLHGGQVVPAGSGTAIDAHRDTPQARRRRQAATWQLQ